MKTARGKKIINKNCEQFSHQDHFEYIELRLLFGLVEKIVYVVLIFLYPTPTLLIVLYIYVNWCDFFVFFVFDYYYCYYYRIPLHSSYDGHFYFLTTYFALSVICTGNLIICIAFSVSQFLFLRIEKRIAIHKYINCERDSQHQQQQ